jgi:hypothetical protein
VLLHEIDDQKEVDSARKYNAQFDGIGPSDLGGTAKFFSTSKDKLEEKFRNIEIRQDGPLGLVTCNHHPLFLPQLTNSGFKVWQLRKIDGQWKILSLTWTSYDRS